MLGLTTIGKNRPLSASGEFLEYTGLSTLHQSAKAFSVSAFDQMLVETPCCVAVCDEVGTNLLAKIGHKKASTHEIGIKGILLELWSREDGMVPYITNRHARMKGVKGPVRFIIERPSFTILSASTPATFWESIPRAAIKDGFINRWLLCKSAIRGATQNVSREQRQEVPASIVVKLQALVPRMGHGNMDGLLGRVYEFETARKTSPGWRTG